MPVLLYAVSAVTGIAAVSHYNVHQLECSVTGGFTLACIVSGLAGYIFQRLDAEPA